VARRPPPTTAPTAEPATTPAPPCGHVVHEGAVYSADAFRRTFGLRTSSLRREVRERRLKVHKRCGKYFILGADVLAWLRGGTAEPTAVVGGNGTAEHP
jgi:hypothetical protein